MCYVNRLTTFLLVLVICFTYTACKKDRLIGNEVIPEDNRPLGIFTDTVSIVSYTVPEHPLRTNNLSQYLLGSYNDPVFGRATAGIFTQLTLPATNLQVGDSLKLDSVVLSLQYTGFYGDSMVPQSVRVYRVTESMSDSGETYLSTKSFAHENTPIGEKLNFIPNLKDSVPVLGDNQPAHLRIRLDSSFGKELLNPVNNDIYTSQENFTEFLKGLYIAPDTTQGGGIMYMKPGAVMSKLTLFFQSTSGEDSLRIEFGINNLTVTTNYFKHNYSTLLTDAISSPDSVKGEDSLFVQSNSSVKAKLEFPHIDKMSNISVNKAELVVTAVSTSSTYPAPERLLVFLEGDDGTNRLLPEHLLESESYFGGKKKFETDSLGNTIIRYRFNLARYFQKLVNGEIKGKGLYIVTSPELEIADRVILGGNLHSENPVKLNLIYTPINP